MENQIKDLLKNDISSVLQREQAAFDELAAPFGKSIVLFGAGSLGRKVLSCLRNAGIEPLAFADNNPKLWNSRIEGVLVLSPQDAVRQFGQKAAFVVTIRHAGYAFIQTREQLLQLNCRRIVPFMALYWKFPGVFLPHYYLDLPHKIYDCADNVYKAFSLFSDEQSKKEYLSQLRYRILLDHNLPPPVAHDEYFPDDLFTMGSKEVFVDCGAFDGDTVKSYLRRRGSDFRHIIALEPDPINFQRLSTYVSSLDRNVRDKIILQQVAVGSKEGNVSFDGTGTVESSVKDSGSIVVLGAPLDKILKDYVPTYIKMDIEGSELDALAGTRELIERYKPILAVCVYHRQDHLWQIPLYLKSLFEGYKLFLRPHDFEGWDLVCYAVPDHRLIRS